MKVAKEFKFHAAHRDVTAPEGDQCGRLHGHTYRLLLEVEGPLDARGMVLHGDTLKAFFGEIIEPRVEHQYLNERLDFNPTMEAVCSWVTELLREWLDLHLFPMERSSYKIMVRLWETPTMYAEDTA